MTKALINQYIKTYKEIALNHRYISLNHIKDLLKKYENCFDVKTIGDSVLGNPIHVIKIGKGQKKVLMWSQMHGNESTTTKAIFDLCQLFSECTDKEIQTILNSCTIAIIPMLNPDGAKAYTRLNANDIDLNRDAQELSQPESKILRTFFNDFKPYYCFNLHGQRTIFSAGSSNLPATVSFLAPAQDENCSVTHNRKIAMEIIAVMNENLQQLIPNQVGIYDDAFNINCVGDTFQSYNVPTILFEAGHYANDYARDKTRQFIFHALLTALNYISITQITGERFKEYLKIPQNEKLFYDIIIRNAKVKSKVQDIGIIYQEKLIENKIEFVPVVEKISDLNIFYGHIEKNANKSRVFKANKMDLNEGDEIDFVLINDEIFSLIFKNN
jgi:hypothetical protein